MITRITLTLLLLASPALAQERVSQEEELTGDLRKQPIPNRMLGDTPHSLAEAAPETSAYLLDRHGEPENLSGLTLAEVQEKIQAARAPEFKEEYQRRQRLRADRLYRAGHMSRRTYFKYHYPERWCEFGPEPLPEGVHPMRVQDLLFASRGAPDDLRWELIKRSGEVLASDDPLLAEIVDAMGADVARLNWAVITSGPLDYDVEIAKRASAIQADRVARGIDHLPGPPRASTTYVRDMKLHIEAPDDPVCLEQKRAKGGAR